MLSFVTSATYRMQSLIRGLLDYSRIGRTSKPLKIDFAILVNEILTDLSVAISEANAVIDCSKLPIINGYELELRILFQNLISNAIKFRRKGTSPCIEISAEPEADLWKFKVKDNGIGIPEMFTEKIFDLFQRLNPLEEYPGTGIGLSHCKK